MTASSFRSKTKNLPKAKKNKIMTNVRTKHPKKHEIKLKLDRAHKESELHPPKKAVPSGTKPTKEPNKTKMDKMVRKTTKESTTEVKGTPKTGIVKEAFEGQTSKKEIKKKKFSKQDRRALRLKSKKHSDIVIGILPLFEVLRRDDTSEEKRFEIIESILTKAKKNIPDLCLAHDTSRIIECIVQHGTEAQRWTLFAEMKKYLRLLAKARYGKFIVLKLLKYGAKEHRLELFKAFRSHVARLVNHRIAVEVVDSFYNEYANATQRGELMQELYGNIHTLKLAENHVFTLSAALDLNATKRKAILHNVNALLCSLTTKGLTKYSIVQHLLVEYLQVLPAECESANHAKSYTVETPMKVDEPEQTSAAVTDAASAVISTSRTLGDHLSSLLELLVDGQVVPMLHTREGVRAALRVLWSAPSRLRKILVRNLKTCISSIARNEHGHLFLIGLLDTVDDMVLLNKVVIKEILDDFDLFCTHPEARKVLLYALSPRDSHNFSPQLQQSLFAAGDDNLHTKKPLGIRALELRNPKVKVLPRLLKLINTDLIRLFVGDPTPEGRVALEDRGRIVLMTEALIRSAPYHLDPTLLMKTYQRNQSASVDDESGLETTLVLEHDDVDKLSQLRQQSLQTFVKLLLVPPFNPVGSSNVPRGQGDRNEERIRRHKRAVALAEQALAQGGKPNFESFELGGQSETLPNPSDESSVVSMPFIERPEGQLCVRRLLKDEQTHSTFTLGRLILEHVPPTNLQSWTRCNRSCFVLVQLCELGDPTIIDLLRSSLAPCMVELEVSPLPGSKVLYKHLTCTKQ